MVEATIIDTSGNSLSAVWDDSATGLIENDGLEGTEADVNTNSKCAVSERRNIPFLPDIPAYFSLELNAPQKVMRIQLAFRTDCCTDHGKNVKVEVGSSPLYNYVFNSVCTTIGQLAGTGLVDYDCDQYHEGRYIHLSTDEDKLVICEAKVFVEAG